MTRETKIGLLVGLAFIIVIGILLSDHFRGAMELPPAALDRAGPNVLQAINTLGSGQVQPAIVTPPAEVSPRLPVPTPRDLEPRPNPVTLTVPTPPAATSPNPAGVDQALADAARKQGEELVSVGPQGSTSPIPVTTNINPPAASRQYTAVPGDSLSKMAAHLMGANTKANRAAIIAANPDLQQNADRVIAGQTYVIPTPAGATASPPPSVSPPVTSAVTPTESGAVYTVQAGDNLWRIASSQVGDSGAIAAIEELNRDVLAGGTTVRPGMKLRLPAKRLASAN